MYFDDKDLIIEDENMEKLLQIKTTELFKLCDEEQKGFIVKKDMQKMKNIVNLSPEVLEDVFDSLDRNRNGYLTLPEFISGFSDFLGFKLNTTKEEEDVRDGGGAEEFFSEKNELNEEDEIFKETIDALGAGSLLDELLDIKPIWCYLRKQDGNMQRVFENLIEYFCKEVRRLRIEFLSVESALQNKKSLHDEEVTKLYEEMESQLKVEKARIVGQEKLKERDLKEIYERELLDKEKQLQESLNRQNELEKKLFKKNLADSEYKHENEELKQQKNELEEQLEEMKKELEEAQNLVKGLKEQIRNERRERARQTIKYTENCVLERDAILKETEILREGNKRLKDERDELKLQITTNNKIEAAQQQPVDYKKQESVLAKYFRTLSFSTSMEVDESNGNLNKTNQLFGANKLKQNESFEGVVNIPLNTTAPDRVFKIILIGDSGVGKTSFVQRFCNSSFKEGFNTTIGVDFQVKSLLVDNKMVTLQFWDTAGQERFRSITKQYFRKADGVICMYDVTSEQSFKNVRNWMNSVKESAEESCVILMIGNKIDLCETDDNRVIKYRDGECLADEYSCLFFETSTKMNTNILEAVEALTRILQVKEDKSIDDVLNLRINQEKKKRCCS